MTARERVAQLLKAWPKIYPTAHCELNFHNPLQLLVATILSAQSTDKRVNMVTPALFRKYRTAKNYADAPQAELENAIKSTGFYRNKTKSIRGAMRAIAEKHGGNVPDTMAELCALPGVGRKTANVVLGNAFHKDEGIVVDTHVLRLSQRLGLTKQKDPVKIESDLMKLVPREHWTNWSHWLTVAKAFHVFTHTIYNAHKLVTNGHRHWNRFLCPRIPVVNVHVSPTDGCFQHANEHVIAANFWNRNFLEP